MFRNLSFRTKLALILVPPILMLLVLATSVVSPRLDQKQSAGENLLQARYAIAVMEVLDNIQTERGAAVEVASTKGVSGKDRFAEHRASTDAAKS